jgi:hypothetical protein
MKNMASMLMTEYQQGFDIENYLQATSYKWEVIGKPIFTTH